MRSEEFQVSVVMARVSTSNAWVPERWEARAVIAHAQETGPPRVLIDFDRERQVLHTGFKIDMRRDEAQGYYLNITSAAPSAFVMWRMQEDEAVPVLVTASYDEAARWLDAGENVDSVSLPADFLEPLRQFVSDHYKPERKRGRKRDRAAAPDGT